MGLLEDEIWPRHTKILMQEMLFLSQKQIAVRWMQVAPPSVNQWMKAVDQILPYKKKKKMCEHRGVTQSRSRMYGLMLMFFVTFG